MDAAGYLGIPQARMEQMHGHLRSRAAELGLPFNSNPRIVNTHKALLLTEWARQKAPAQVDAVHRALFHAYFVEASNLADDEVLRAICAKVGMPADQALAELQDPALEKRLTESMELGYAYGVTGTPAFIINKRYKIVGAQPYDAMLKALRQIANQ